MMLSTAFCPVFGINDVVVHSVPTRPQPASVAAVENPLARLVALYQSNSHLFTELKSVRSQISRTRDYLATPGCHLALGAAQLRRLQARHAATLALLRTNRIEAHEWLAGLDAAQSA